MQLEKVVNSHTKGHKVIAKAQNLKRGKQRGTSDAVTQTDFLTDNAPVMAQGFLVA